MPTDPGLQSTRDIRVRLSREHGNDPRRLVEHYMDYQTRFADRLRRASCPGQGPDEAAENREAPDGSSARG